MRKDDAVISFALRSLMLLLFVRKPDELSFFYVRKYAAVISFLLRSLR